MWKCFFHPSCKSTIHTWSIWERFVKHLESWGICCSKSTYLWDMNRLLQSLVLKKQWAPAPTMLYRLWNIPIIQGKERYLEMTCHQNAFGSHVWRPIIKIKTCFHYIKIIIRIIYIYIFKEINTSKYIALWICVYIYICIICWALLPHPGCNHHQDDITFWGNRGIPT